MTKQLPLDLQNLELPRLPYWYIHGHFVAHYPGGRKVDVRAGIVVPAHYEHAMSAACNMLAQALEAERVSWTTGTEHPTKVGERFIEIRKVKEVVPA